MLNKNGNRSRIGSTPSLYAFRPNRIDTHNLKRAKRAVAMVDPHVSRSDLLRDGLALLAHQAEEGGEWTELVHERKERAELERRLEAAERKADRLEKQSIRDRKKARKKTLDMEALLRYLPDIRRRAAQNMHDVPMNVHAIDQVWNSCGRDWNRVVKRLEDVQRELDEEQHDPGGGS